VAGIEKAGARREPIRPTSRMPASSAARRKRPEQFRRARYTRQQCRPSVRKRFSESSTEDWRKQIDTCLYGALNAATAPGPLLEASGRGGSSRSWEDSSRVGEFRLALPRRRAPGTIALMKSLAREWGRSGVTATRSPAA